MFPRFSPQEVSDVRSDAEAADTPASTSAVGTQDASGADDHAEHAPRAAEAALARVDQPPKVWMRAIHPHTYHGVPQDVGSVYLADDVGVEIENIENLRFAVRDTPPPKAVRP